MSVQNVDLKEPTDSEGWYKRYLETRDIQDYIAAYFYYWLEDERFLELCAYEFAYRDFEGLEDYFESEYESE